MGRLEDAHRSYQRSLALWQRLANAEPDHPRAPMEVVETRILLADVTLSMGDPAASHALLDAAQADLDAGVAPPADDPVQLSIVSMLYERQANRFMAFGEFERAAVYIEALPDLVRRTARASREGLDRLTALEELPLALSMVSLVRSRLGDPEGSIALAIDAARLGDSIADLPGATQRMEGIRINAWGQLGWRYREASRPGDAGPPFTRAVDGARLMLDADPANQAAAGLLGSMLFARGGARIGVQDWEGALDDHREALGLLGAVYPPGPVADLSLAPVSRGEAEALTGLGRFDQAEGAFRATLDRYGRAGPAAADPQQQKLRAIAELAYSSHLERRRAVEGTADCALSADLLGQASRRWEALHEQGAISPGEERIWADLLAAMPASGCPGG